MKIPRPSRRRLLLAGAVTCLSLLATSHAIGNTGTLPAPTSEGVPGPRYRPVTPFLEGKRLHRSEDLQAVTWARANDATGWLAPVLRTPQARWVNSPADLPSLADAAASARRSGTVLVVVAYAIPDRGCSGGKEGLPSAAAYTAFVRGMVRALSGSEALVVLEPDAVAADCYTPQRGEILARATSALTRAGQHVYIDAGHSGWRLTGEVARRLLESGITQADGFAVNVASRAPVAQARRYGEELSALVGDRGFVVDTSRNGAGQAVDAQGQQLWCNPPTQALGPKPSTRSVGHNVALLWIKNPGESDGNWDGCGEETAYPGLFSPRQAHQLIGSATWVPARTKALLPEVSTVPWTR